MLVSTKGIVLHKTKYKDTSLIVNIFTEQYGLLAFLVKGAFSKKSKINYSYFAPLSLLELHFNSRKSDILFLTECSHYKHFQRIPFDILRNSISHFYWEIIQKSLCHSNEDVTLFRFLEKSILELDAEQISTADIHIRFIVEFSKYLGFAPKENYSDKDCYFNLQNASFINIYYDTGDFLSKEAAFFLYQILSHNYSYIPSKSVRLELLHFWINYLKYHIEGMQNIHSLEVLTDLFG
jgi:DNA repair protein RecO (recombination protein O)